MRAPTSASRQSSHRDALLADLLKRRFHVRAPSNLRRASNVVVCFHGHTNSARDEEDWPLKACFPSGTSFLYLSGPYPYRGQKNAFEWFPYVRDQGADDVDRSVVGSTLAQYMSAMNLDAQVEPFERTIDWIEELYGKLSSMGKRVYFVGSSQGGATAFTAAVRILGGKTHDATLFRGAFAHRMAGLYPKLLGHAGLPQGVDVRVVIDREDTHGAIVSKKMNVEDTHGHWLPKDLDELARAGRAAFHDLSASVELVVMLNANDRVVPSALARYVQGWAKRHAYRERKRVWHGTVEETQSKRVRREAVKETPSKRAQHEALEETPPRLWHVSVAPAG